MSIPRFNKGRLCLALAGLTLLAGCATFPEAPTVMVLPGSNISLAQFNMDDDFCRVYAQNRAGGSANQAAQSATVRNAAIGTAVGTVAGLAIGNNRSGAATGAGAGLLIGTAAGAEAGQRSGESSQQVYNNAYIQCMYTKGHRVPVSGNFVQNQGATPAIPPPPPGNPPPPPPGVQP